MSTRWLDDDEMAAWIRLAAVLELLSAIAGAILEKVDPTGMFAAPQRR